MSFDPKSLNTFPNGTGIYIMKDPEEVVLYVGKAKNIKNRLKSYFFGQDLRPMISSLISQIETIETIVVNTEKEALILENNLIKKYKPKYNILLKDDKTYVSLMITKEKWPVIKLVRKKASTKEDHKYFGPYTNAKAARQTLDLIIKIFPLRQCSDNFFKNRKRPCLLYDIKRCVAPCVGKCSWEEYTEFINYAASLLKGQNKEILKILKEKMKTASENLEFEKANELLTIIKEIEHVQQVQHVENLSAKNTDALAMHIEGDNVLIIKLIFREGRLTGSSHFNFSQVINDDSTLESFILQHYLGPAPLPAIILVPLDLPNKHVLEELIFSSTQKKIKIIHPQKGEKQSLIQMAMKNALAVFNKEKDSFLLREKLLLNLQELLKLNNFPRHIECFDSSNISETLRVAALITFINGEYDKSKTRLFKIKTEKKGDIAALEEILERHYSKIKEEKKLPDLLIVDGGKAQLNIALKVLKKLNIATVDVFGVAKEKARHDKGLTQEQIFLPGEEPILIDIKSPLIFLLQKIRDEAHRVAISFHISQRKIVSALDGIEGIGPVKKNLLLKHFKSVVMLKKASKEELDEVAGLTKKDKEKILEFIKKDS